MGRIFTKLSYEVDVEIDDSHIDVEGLAEQILDQGSTVLAEQSIKPIVKSVICESEDISEVDLKNAIELKGGIVERKRTQFAVRVANNCNIQEVKQHLKYLDPTAVFDSEGNPVTFWVETILFENEIEQIYSVFCAIESKGGIFKKCE